MEGPGRIVSLVLAAGAARRFGGRKQLARLAGRPLLEHALRNAAASPTAATVLVLGAHAAEIEANLDLAEVEVVHCADWKKGRLASLRRGIAALDAGVEAALITLGDEPFVPAAAAGRLLASRRPDRPAIRATYDGRPGHPVLVERPLFAAFEEAPDDARPATLLGQAGVHAVECGDLGESPDVDTPEQLAALERAREEDR